MKHDAEALGGRHDAHDKPRGAVELGPTADVCQADVGSYEICSPNEGEGRGTAVHCSLGEWQVTQGRVGGESREVYEPVGAARLRL